MTSSFGAGTSSFGEGAVTILSSSGDGTCHRADRRNGADISDRVIWGESVGTSDFSVFVDASTGQYLEKTH